jgi:ADP-ribose pyrophosphatase YjhB (NUDIX family)
MTFDQGVGPRTRKIPEGDDRPRLVCGDCGYILYENPRIIVGAVCAFEGRFLLCRRAIEPRRGYWTMPMGYLEMQESTEAGALREVWEEAQARVEIDALLAVYSVPRIGQVHMVYRATMVSPEHKPGVESLDTAMFAWEDIPWDDLAYPNVHWALNQWREAEGKNGFAPFGVPPGYTGHL